MSLTSRHSERLLEDLLISSGSPSSLLQMESSITCSRFGVCDLDFDADGSKLDVLRGGSIQFKSLLQLG